MFSKNMLYTCLPKQRKLQTPSFPPFNIKPKLKNSQTSLSIHHPQSTDSPHTHHIIATNLTPSLYNYRIIIPIYPHGMSLTPLARMCC